MKRIALLIFIVGVTISCSKQEKLMTDEDFLKDQENWRERRTNHLKDPYGWLSLAGLFWLENGVNTFGSDSTNDIIFPNKKAPKEIGRFIVNDDEVTALINRNVEVITDGYPATVLKLVPDDEDGPTTMTWGPLKWYLVKRGDRYGIRLKDSTNQVLQEFKGMDMYPPSQDWLLKAKIEKYDPPKEVTVPDILGNSSDELVTSAAVFKVKGEEYRLDLLDTSYEGHYFLIFADRTNGHGTYGAGRFAYIPFEDSTGYTFLDFNKAYSPPCIFTPFATCPIPPIQNRLPIMIEAGEKSTGYDDH